MEDLKHNIEQVVAGTDRQTLRKVAKTTVYRVHAYLEEGLVGLSTNEKKCCIGIRDGKNFLFI